MTATSSEADSLTSRPARPRCVIYTARGDGQGDTLPIGLLRALRSRGLELRVQVDAHEALAELIEMERAPARVPTILLVIEPTRLDRATRLLSVLMSKLPRVVVWRYDADHSPQLRGWSLPMAAEPKLRLAVETDQPVGPDPDVEALKSPVQVGHANDVAAHSTSHNDEASMPPGDAASNNREHTPDTWEHEPLISQQELHMLLHRTTPGGPPTPIPPTRST